MNTEETIRHHIVFASPWDDRIDSGFKLTAGSLRYHLATRINGGLHKRGFCADCGSRITGGESEPPSKNIGVFSGSLDDPSQFQPTMDIFTCNAQPWDQMDPSLQKFEKYPPSS